MGISMAPRVPATMDRRKRKAALFLGFLPEGPSRCFLLFVLIKVAPFLTALAPAYSRKVLTDSFMALLMGEPTTKVWFLRLVKQELSKYFIAFARWQTVPTVPPP